MRHDRKGTWTGTALILGLACVALFVTTDSQAARVRLKQWEMIQNERYGFMIAYPGSVFTPRQNVSAEAGPEKSHENSNENGPDNGHVLVSRDGGARLLVGAFDNETAATLAEYRDQLLSENYSGADLDYAPVKKRSFVVSGTRGTMHFYERVSFTCNGRFINSWALLYPVSERHIYDRIVEAIAPTYSPGAGRTGQCD